MIVLITSLIFIGVSIIYIFFSEEAKSFFLAYFIFPFFSIVSFTVLRIYTSIKKHRLEAENRLAMAKMLAHIENPDNKLIAKEYYQKQFLFQSYANPHPEPTLQLEITAKQEKVIFSI